MSNTLASQPIFQLKTAFTSSHLDLLNFLMYSINARHHTFNNFSITADNCTLGVESTV